MGLHVDSIYIPVLLYVDSVYLIHDLYSREVQYGRRIYLVRACHQ